MSLYFDEEEAISELQKRGYRVIKEKFPKVEFITTIRELVDYFYSRRKFYNPDRKFPYSIDYTEDNKYISSFIRSREKLGLGRKAAVQEAAVLIDTLFKFEEHLKLKTPIISPTILAVRPIMDRVCSFANGEVDEVAEWENLRFIDVINEKYEKKFFEADFKEAEIERKAILEKT